MAELLSGPEVVAGMSPEPWGLGVLAGVRVRKDQDARPQLSDVPQAWQHLDYEAASFTGSS